MPWRAAARAAPSGQGWLGRLGDAVKFEVELGAAFAEASDLGFELGHSATQPRDLEGKCLFT
jgi:hypothetical protein